MPDGAAVLAPVGTAPGLVVPVAAGRSGPPVLVLPGPPRELQGMWPAALADPRDRSRARRPRGACGRARSGCGARRESELAATLREHEGDLIDLEITTCLRDGELEIVTRYGAPAQPTL